MARGVQGQGVCVMVGGCVVCMCALHIGSLARAPDPAPWWRVCVCISLGILKQCLDDMVRAISTLQQPHGMVVVVCAWGWGGGVGGGGEG